MELKDTESKMFKQVGYDPASQRLQIRFHPKKGQTQGPVYEYGDEKTPFTPTHWEALRTAESKGGHFSRHVKGHFPFRQIEPGTAAAVN